MKKLFLAFILLVNSQPTLIKAATKESSTSLLHAAPAIALISVVYGLYSFLNNFNNLLGMNIKLLEHINENLKESKNDIANLEAVMKINNELQTFLTSLDLKPTDKETLRSIITKKMKSYNFQGSF